MMTRMDNDIGKLMSLLKELNLEMTRSYSSPAIMGHVNKAQLFQSAGPLRGIKRDLSEGGFANR